jgi:hypothetical protein
VKRASWSAAGKPVAVERAVAVESGKVAVVEVWLQANMN